MVNEAIKVVAPREEKESGGMFGFMKDVNFVILVLLGLLVLTIALIPTAVVGLVVYYAQDGIRSGFNDWWTRLYSLLVLLWVPSILFAGGKYMIYPLAKAWSVREPHQEAGTHIHMIGAGAPQQQGGGFDKQMQWGAVPTGALEFNEEGN